jgi:DeoR/GlpR family transcriptional regulator of sugar metabolism
MHEDRLKTIQHYLYAHGTSSIETLVDHLGASPATVRRDLARLEADGVIERTHGGARLAESSGLEIAFNLRERENLEVKRAIGRAAYRHLRPNSTVLMDAGTTVLQLARAIRLNPMPLTVITNGLALAQELVGLEGVEVILLGGQLRADNLSSVGPYAEKMLEEFWCDQLFLGTTAVNGEHDLMTLDADEASINRKMLARASERVLLADSSKFGHRGPYRVANLETISSVISDDGLSETWREHIGTLGLTLECARLNGEQA